MWKPIALKVLGLTPLSRLLARTQRGTGTIFLMHRFASEVNGFEGHDPRLLRRALGDLRRAGARLVSVDELVERLVAVSPGAQVNGRNERGPLVAFTVDDGYQDFADIAAPIFQEFDCPATVFVVPEVIAGRCWFWWDQLTWLAQQVDGTLTTTVEGVELCLRPVRSSPGLDPSLRQLAERVRGVSRSAMRAVIDGWARQVGLAFPAERPARFRVMDWDTLRQLEAAGFRVGAHSMTHPILARCADAEAEWEITESLARVRAEMKNPSRLFAYPNGQPQDFGTREECLVQRAGCLGGLSTSPGRVPTTAAPRDMRAFSLPRFGYEDRDHVPTRIVLLD